MSAKKKAAGRRSAQTKVPGSTQSGAERRAAEAQLRALVAKFAPAHQRLSNSKSSSPVRRRKSGRLSPLDGNFILACADGVPGAEWKPR
jgi:hypothetical protein